LVVQPRSFISVTVGINVRHQPLERRALNVAARVAAVVVAIRDADPPLVLLAGDVRLGALALSIERAELLLEAFLGALARVDRTTDRLGRLAGVGLHRSSPSAKPKNR
jgi:hypothetical protein